MANDVTHRRYLRGTAAENDGYTGLDGEVTVDTTNKTLRVHDGFQSGGYAMAKKAEVDALATQVAGKASQADVTALAGTVAGKADASALTGKADKTTVEAALAGKADKESGTPVGSVFYFAGTTAPDGYLVCDGSAISRTTYASLFAAIGTTWGAPDSGKFNIPDLVNRFPEGSKTPGTYADAGLPNIEGEMYGIVTRDGWGSSGAITESTDQPTRAYSAGGSYSLRMGVTLSLDASNSSEVYGKSETVQPAAARLLPIIKY